MEVRVPRLNSNEDYVTLNSLAVTVGGRVRKGEEIASVESTKAAMSIEAPCDGIVSAIHLPANQEVPVDALLCEIRCADEEPAQARSAVTDVAAAPAALKITAKARLVAAELGVDLSQVKPVDGRIGEAEVRAHATASKGMQLASPAAAVIIGAGGHAACLIDALQGSPYQLIGCTDANLAVGTEVLNGVKVLGSDEILPDLLQRGVRFAFIGIGDPLTNRRRAEIAETLMKLGFILPSVIAPGAQVSSGCEIGPGTVILRGATVGPRCKIGANVLVNQGAIVCHDSRLEDHCHIAPGAILAGNCHVGAGTTVGMGATVFMGVSLGEWSLIHNGASITRNLPAHVEVDRDNREKRRE